MKKTTHTKSFTGWGLSRDTAKLLAKIAGVPNSSGESPLYDSEEEAANGVDFLTNPGKPVKVRVTYTVTLEPVATKK